MFNSDRFVRVEHFFGVPAESIFGGVKSRPRLFRSFTRTHATLARRARRAQASLTGVRPLTLEYCSPSNPGTPQNCLRRFCGEPHSGFPPPLRHSTCSPSRRRKLRRSSIARLLLFPFRIYIRRGPLGGFNPPKMRDLLFHKGANRAFMKTPLEKSLSLALTYSSSEQYSLNVARFAPPKILSAGTPMGRGGRLDAHEARVYLTPHLACEVAFRAAAFKRRLRRL